VIRDIAAEASAELSSPTDDLPPALLAQRPDDPGGADAG